MFKNGTGSPVYAVGAGALDRSRSKHDGSRGGATLLAVPRRLEVKPVPEISAFLLMLCGAVLTFLALFVTFAPCALADAALAAVLAHPDAGTYLL